MKNRLIIKLFFENSEERECRSRITLNRGGGGGGDDGLRRGVVVFHLNVLSHLSPPKSLTGAKV